MSDEASFRSRQTSAALCYDSGALFASIWFGRDSHMKNLTSAASPPVALLSRRFLVGLFVFALILRVFYVLFAVDNKTVGSWADSGTSIALSLLHGKGYVSSWEVCRNFQSFRTPVLPFVLYALWATFGYSIVLAKLLMAVVSAATCVCLALLANRLFDTRVGIATGLAAALCTSFIRWTGTLGAETLAQFFLVAGVYALCNALPGTWESVSEPRSWFGRFCLSGLMFGLLCLTRPLWLPYIALMALALIIAERNGRALKQAGILCAVVALIMLPWVARNVVIHRTFVVASTEGGIAFLEANNPISYAGKGDWAMHFAAHQPDVQRASRTLPEAAFDRFMFRKGLRYAAADPKDFARVYLLRLGYLWRPVPPPQLAGDLSGKHIFWLASWWGSLTVLMIVGFGLWRPWRQVQHWPLLLVLLWGSLVIPLFSSQLRYRAPLELFILLYGVAGWFAFYDFWRRRSVEGSHRVLDMKNKTL